MATEVGKLVVELQARVDKLERGLRRGQRSISGFQRRASRAFKRVGTSFTRLVKRFSGLGIAIGAAAAAFGFAQFIRASIRAAAEVETFRIRLRALIGDATEADQTLESLTNTAQKVAPSLRQIIEAAATLGTVALGSSAKIETLVDTALNIQAVTGLTLTQTAQNLQRALSAGIGAADLFRERGIRALLEALTDFSDLVQAPISDVAKAFEEVFGKGGVFSGAAEQFAQTLPGAISRTSDAMFKLQTAVGQALSPVIIAFLTETIIPALDDLTTQAKEGEDAFASWAQGAIVALAKGFLFVVDAIASIIKGVANLRVQIPSMLADVLIALANVVGSILRGGNILGKLLGISNDQMVGLLNSLRGGASAMIAFANSGEDGVNKVNVAMDALHAKTDEYRVGLNNLGVISRRNAAAAQADATETLAKLKLLLQTARLVDDPRVTRKAEAARARLNKMLEKSAAATERAGEPLLLQIASIDRQTAALTEQEEILRSRLTRIEEAVAAQDELNAREGLTAEQRASGQARLAFLVKLREKEGDVIAKVLLPAEREKARLMWQQSVAARQLSNARSRELRLSDRLENAMKAIPPLRAAEGREIVNKLFLELQSEKSIVRQNALRKQAIEDLKDLAAELRGLEELGDTIGFVIASQIQDSLMTMIRGGAVDFGELLADTAAKLLEQSLIEVLKGLGASLNQLFEKIGGAGLGGKLAASLGFGALLLSGLFKDTEVESSAAKVESAVTSTQAVRGVVAGPTQIAVAQVGRSVQEAFVETNLILRRQLTVLADILASLIGGPTSEAGAAAAGFGDDSDEILASSSASLV